MHISLTAHSNLNSLEPGIILLFHSVLILELQVSLELNDTFSESAGSVEGFIVFDKAFETGFGVSTRSNEPGDNVTAPAVGTYSHTHR